MHEKDQTDVGEGEMVVGGGAVREDARPAGAAVPRPAAAAIVLHGDGEPRILLARRNRTLRFMAGHHVFPGGRVDAQDWECPVRDATDAELSASIAAAAREVFEETGLLCTRGRRPDVGALRAARLAVLKGAAPFHAVLKELNADLAAEDWINAGLWITPSFSPIRFHTRYFIYRLQDTPYEEVIEHDGEITGLDWLSANEARRRWQRGDLKLSTPVAFVLRHLADLPLAQALPLLQHSPGQDEHVPSRFEMRRGVHIIPLRTSTLPPATHTNCVVLGEQELYVVDPGASDAAERAHFKEHLDQLLAVGDRIAAVLLTHSHPDHVGAAEWLRETYGAPIWAHEAAASQLDFPIDRHLRDLDVISIPGDLGWRVQCHHTPGHDPGHLCFHEATTHTLLCGDMLGNPGTIIISPDYGGDMTAYLKSLETLLHLDFNFMIPAHGMPFFSRECKEKIRDLITHRHDREQKVKAGLAAGVNTMGELLAVVYQDTPTDTWPLARHSLRAHLARLGWHVDETDAIMPAE
jgi:glyoxylase-like metal-dependent hydrolase (beta-lactamase superfamily II)/8-oxo-dGTP pyrophosphatase MutT (NUDIX family)